MAAEFSHRLEGNVPGRYYVDDQCLDCDLCRETAPMVFLRNDAIGSAYVARQPATDEERSLCEEAVEGCPCGAIGNDGDEHDWSSPITHPPGKGGSFRHCSHCHSPKSNWSRIAAWFRRRKRMR
ncbi:MAG: ferredoxin [Verrucomicrobiae bacterium]|nr:ferredoxin [Verrucomicrobiae bacterium]